MSSILCSQGVVLATAMAVSGTVILLAFRLQKSLPISQFPDSQISQSSQRVLRSCISSERKKMKKTKKKRVQFAEDVVEPRGNGEEFRRQHSIAIVETNSSSSSSSSTVAKTKKSDSGEKVRKNRGMPANRVALYNGILRDRVVQRIAYSY